jgi:hypothetical protein
MALTNIGLDFQSLYVVIKSLTDLKDHQIDAMRIEVLEAATVAASEAARKYMAEQGFLVGTVLHKE